MAAPKAGFMSGLLSKIKGTPTGVSEKASSLGRLGRQSSLGKKYVEMGTPSQNFNASGFLRNSPTPKKT